MGTKLSELEARNQSQDLSEKLSALEAKNKELELAHTKIEEKCLQLEKDLAVANKHSSHKENTPHKQPGDSDAHEEVAQGPLQALVNLFSPAKAKPQPAQPKAQPLRRST